MERKISELTASNSARAFGQVLRHLRQKRNLTQEHVASGASMPIQRYTQIDLGCSEPDLIELFRIAQAVEIDPSELVRLFEEHFPQTAHVLVQKP